MTVPNPKVADKQATKILATPIAFPPFADMPDRLCSDYLSAILPHKDINHTIEMASDFHNFL
jgi:hypothetical protein